MEHRRIKKVTAALLLSAVIFTTNNAVVAQQASDIDAVRAANQAFYGALSARDISAMQRVWSSDVDIQNIGPVSKAPAVGWDEIKKRFEDTFASFSELKVSMELPRIKVYGSIAWVSGIEQGESKGKDGVPHSSTNLATNIFEKKSNGWQMVYHHASRTPQ
jgi:ketosteroid isomerase-like protein